MLLALAWRNVWRNARRSLITMVALAVGVTGIVALMGALMLGGVAVRFSARPRRAAAR